MGKENQLWVGSSIGREVEANETYPSLVKGFGNKPKWDFKIKSANSSAIISGKTNIYDIISLNSKEKILSHVFPNHMSYGLTSTGLMTRRFKAAVFAFFFLFLLKLWPPNSIMW